MDSEQGYYTANILKAMARDMNKGDMKLQNNVIENNFNMQQQSSNNNEEAW